MTVWFGTLRAMMSHGYVWLLNTQRYQRRGAEGCRNEPIRPCVRYTANLHTILEKLTSSDSPYAVADTEGLNIVLITPPPFYPDMLDAEGRTHRALDNTKKYVDAVLKVGKEWQAKHEGKKWRIGVVNMWDGIYTPLLEARARSCVLSSRELPSASC